MLTAGERRVEGFLIRSTYIPLLVPFSKSPSVMLALSPFWTFTSSNVIDLMFKLYI